MTWRTLVRQVVPEPARYTARRQITAARSRAARRAFARAAGEAPAWLDAALLPELHDRYRPPERYLYTEDALLARGRERSAQVARYVVPGARTLEVGCGDAMVSALLTERGARATAMDAARNLLDDRALDAGVRFVHGDAVAIPADDATFDLTLSYNAFEHFADPRAVLDEIVRVTRPGGTIFLSFGPLYWSPYGLHASRSVSVPYCQALFEREVLEAFVAERGAKPIPFDTLNGWTPERFRALWRDAPVETISYAEMAQSTGCELITRHPACFAPKVQDFAALTTAIIRGVFRRVDG